MSSKLVFLDRVFGKVDWRDGFINRMTKRGIPAETFFKPVVNDGNMEARHREDEAKKNADFVLFYFGDLPQTDANRVGFYSFLELVIALFNGDLNRGVIVLDATDIPAPVPNSAIFATLAEAEDWLAKQLAE
jgi:hypothetical protein